jgi:Kef-type K+ transport systems, membrane components
MGIPSSYVIIVMLSGIVILSYLFNLLSQKTRIPSVLLLIATGVGINYFSGIYGYTYIAVNKLVKILGAIGLIMIVLEAALDLTVSRKKISLIRNSFSSALVIFVISAVGIGVTIMQWLHVPFESAFLYAIPLSIISSAIVIPSTSHLPVLKKEFIIYESSFSDILGILLFNYMLMKDVLSLQAGLHFVTNLLLAVLISALATLLLLYILAAATVKTRFFLLFAILSLVYALGEMIHLPSLLIVLVFGMVLNNSSLVIKGPFLTKWIKTDKLDGVLDFLKTITAETSFLIRTFFFIIFGYTIDLSIFLSNEVWILGSLIVAILLFVRFLYLKFILKTSLFPELFLMPRGLVTILLFYSIPSEKSLGTFNEGILLFVVVVTSLLMMFGLIFFRKKELPKESTIEII